MKLGRVQSQTDARTLQLSDYLTTLPAPPAREMLDATSTWPMLANDKFNCCTSAAADHMVHHWTATYGSPVVLTDDDIIRAHATLTSDHLLECATMLDSLKLWRNTGIADPSRAQVEGNGLGMSTAMWVAELHNALRSEITCNSNLHHGTLVVSIRLRD